MEHNKNCESLLELGFMPEEIMRLCQFRSVYTEKKLKRNTAERRRLEFARWLVSTGRLTDKLP